MSSKRIPAFKMAFDILNYCFGKMVEGGCTIEPLQVRVNICFVLLANVKDDETDLDVVVSELDSLILLTKKCNFRNYTEKLEELLEIFQEDKE